MMSTFEIPDWAIPQPADAPPSPPPDPVALREQLSADTTRAEQGVNQFLAAKQSALFEAPDAFYRQQGEDAIHAAPVATQKLDQLRNDLLGKLGNDTQRQRLGEALDAQMQLTREGMARHVAEQSLEWQRGVAQDRIALLAKEAAYHHNDEDLVDSLGHAAATAARAHARVGDGPPGGDAEDSAAATARSSILGAAIQAKLDRGDTEGANALFTQVQDQLDPEHASALGVQFSGDPTQQSVAATEAITGSAGQRPAPVLSDASPEPLQAGQQYAAAGDEDEAGHKSKDDPAYQINKIEHGATPEERAAHGDAPLEILRLPPIGIPWIGSKAGSPSSIQSAKPAPSTGASGPQSPLSRMHPDDVTISRNKSGYDFWSKKTTEEIVNSLKEGQKEPLIVREDGKVFQGNTRIKILEERGYDINSLLRVPYDE